MSTTNRYLAGNFGPVDAETTATDLPVTGRVPEELDGRYVRNGPNPVAPVDERASDKPRAAAMAVRSVVPSSMASSLAGIEWSVRLKTVS